MKTKTIGVKVTTDFNEKTIDCFKELSLLFTDLCANVDYSIYEKLSNKYPKAIKLLEVLP